MQHPAPDASHKLPGETTRLTLVRSSLVPHLSLPASIARSWRFCAVTGLISEKNSAQLMARVQLAGFAGPDQPLRPPVVLITSDRGAGELPAKDPRLSRLTALYDRLGEVASDGERARVDLERRLLAEAVVTAFPDAEERGIVERADRLGLGCDP